MHHAGPTILLEVLVFLGAAAALAPLARKLGMSAVMAFLLIGVALGPDGLSRFFPIGAAQEALSFQDGPETRLLAEFGVVFLLFVIGLEVSTERLWSLRRYVLGLGVAQVGVTALAVGLIALAFGHGLSVAAVTGLALALSSTAVVLQLLGERRQMAGPLGRAGFSVLLLQDLAVVPILFLVAALSVAPGEAPAGPLGVLSAIGAAAAALVAIAVAGRLVMRPLLRWAAGMGSREVFMAAALFVVIGAAAAGQAAGLSMALGAFLAGLLLAETEFRHTIEADLEPFKGLLLGLFFVTVGLQIDLDLIQDQAFAVLVGVFGLIALKAAVIIPLARAFGLPWPRAVELGLLLAQAGEFAFVIIALAQSGGLFPAATADYMILVVACSLFLTPLVAQAGAQLGKRLEHAAAATARDEIGDLEGHVVIAGYGRVGQALGAILQDQETPHLGLDLDAGLVKEARDRGWPVHFGDAGRREVLEALKAGRASAIVVTMDNFEAVERVVATVRAAWPQTPVFARARDSAQAGRLHAQGAAFASPETVEATLQLAQALLEGLGFPDETARRVVQDRREAERAAMLQAP